MPPAGEPLTSEEVGLFRRWIDAGAPGEDPDGPPPEELTWWSFTPLQRPAVPADDAAWPRNEVDRFVWAKLSASGLEPSPEADRRTLIRRLTFNLHGLPPEPGDIDRFVTDESPQAYERLVDRLLGSPRYGERWARHWLDVAHYGESHGYDKDKARRNAWPYRDYVIRSFNRDKPYGRFIREQLAGDVLWPEDPEGLVATGFIAAGPWDFVGHAELREGTKDKQLARLLDRDDMLATTMSTFASLTVHCARCHDHKFDPILQDDYYALQAVFAGVDRADQPYFDDRALHARARSLWLRMGRVEGRMRPFEQQIEDAESDEIAEIDREVERLSEETRDLLPKVGEVDTPETVRRRVEIGKRIRQLREQRKRLGVERLQQSSRKAYEDLQASLDELNEEFAELPEPGYVYSAAGYFKAFGTFTFADQPRPVYLLGKGSVEAPLARARPGAVRSVTELRSRFEIAPGSGEGAARAALAEWLASDENPLTWRSAANRVWHYHFGKGLADSPNDFGRMGAPPTHPDLLDWLAVEFRDSGGSFKALHRRILLSATYRQSSSADADRARIDADNRLLWRMNRLRLDAESVRDAALWTAGQLDLEMGGPSAEHFVFKDDHSPVYDYTSFDATSPQSRRRSVYRFLVRSVQDPFMESLDCADPSLLVPKRSSTLTALQALALLNDPLMVEVARKFAALMRRTGASTQDSVRFGIRRALGRPAAPEEVRELSLYADRHGLESAARILLNSNEFIFID